MSNNSVLPMYTRQNQYSDFEPMLSIPVQM